MVQPLFLSTKSCLPRHYGHSPPPAAYRHSVLSLKLRTCIVLISLFILQLSKSLSCEQLLSDNMCCCIYMHTHRRSVLPRNLLLDVGKNLLESSCDLLPARRSVPELYSFYGRSQFQRTRTYVKVRGSNPGTFKQFCFFSPTSPNCSYSLWGPPSFHLGWEPRTVSREAGE